MIMYNKKRSAEWVEAQKKLEADSLEAARLAYMTGKATEEQIALVEEQLAREQESGRKTSFFSKLPSVLSAPEAAPSASSTTTPPPTTFPTRPTTTTTPASVTETVSWPPKQESQPDQAQQPGGAGGLWTWLTSNLKREEEGSPTDGLSSQSRLGWESLSEEDDGAGVRDSDLVRAVEEKQAYIKAKAAAAFEKERENQRKGGPLDRVGTKAGEKGEASAGKGEVEGIKNGVQKGEGEQKRGWFW
ncbi:hypothetical protein VTI74DRAFT_2774 [Chaetomium olivicolor]